MKMMPAVMFIIIAALVLTFFQAQAGEPVNDNPFATPTHTPLWNPSEVFVTMTPAVPPTPYPYPEPNPGNTTSVTLVSFKASRPWVLYDIPAKVWELMKAWERAIVRKQ